MNEQINGPMLYDWLINNMGNHYVFEQNIAFKSWSVNIISHSKDKIYKMDIMPFLKNNVLIISKIPDLLHFLIKFYYKIYCKISDTIIKEYLINISLYTYFSIIDLMHNKPLYDTAELNLLGYNIVSLVYNKMFVCDRYVEECHNNNIDNSMIYIYNPDSF